MNRLKEILAMKAREVAFRKGICPQETIERAARAVGTPARDFVAALRSASVTPAIIAEIKRASPSKGILKAPLDVGATARAYGTGGASAISVLTDHPYFGGDVFDLAIAREASALPVLRKDFILDPYQVFESRAIGADALLLVVAALDRARIDSLLALARELGLAVLVEVHSEKELDVALKAGAEIIGVNNRNLATFSVDIGVAERLLPRVPVTLTRVAESGIRARDDVLRLKAAGADAVLVGEKLMLAKDAAAEIKALRGR